MSSPKASEAGSPHGHPSVAASADRDLFKATRLVSWLAARNWLPAHFKMLSCRQRHGPCCSSSSEWLQCKLLVEHSKKECCFLRKLLMCVNPWCLSASKAQSCKMRAYLHNFCTHVYVCRFCKYQDTRKYQCKNTQTNTIPNLILNM